MEEKMKKMLFLMLFLTILGAANVTSQVRIGGNGAPNPAAVLDLNANDGTNTGGLILPRVSLSDTLTTLNSTTPLGGTVVYNTNTSMIGGQGEGIYIWTGKWTSLVKNVLLTSIKVNKPTLTLFVGSTYTPEITLAPVDASNPQVSWSGPARRSKCFGS
ncbi:hypothetical protein FACS189451_12920 [Bacteroidia bacterium]|nr:hypothetical protein FACS189451_12920 [Bacteroidia bacterium]